MNTRMVPLTPFFLSLLLPSGWQRSVIFPVSFLLHFTIYLASPLRIINAIHTLPASTWNQRSHINIPSMEIILQIGLFYLQKTICVCSKERQSLPLLQINSFLQVMWTMTDTQLMYAPYYRDSSCQQTYGRHVNGHSTFLTHYVAFLVELNLKTEYVVLVNYIFRQS
jgi:hypothetical protein